MPDFKVYAPLSDFLWSGESFEVDQGVRVIRRPDRPYPLRDLEEYLTDFEQDELFWADHWLRLDWSEGEEPSPGELVNLFLVALWIAKPTKTHVKFRFQVATDPDEAPGRPARLLDRFGWVEGAAQEKVTDADLSNVCAYYPLLRSRLRERSGRLTDALILTLAGCQAGRWQVGLVCHAAAAEAILTYDTAPGVTKRLALAYACLAERGKANRDRAFSEFLDVYEKRSDVMHGRGYAVLATDRLPALARFGDLLRTLWKTVILSPTYTQELEGSDSQRKAFFKKLQSGYSPPTK